MQRTGRFCYLCMTSCLWGGIETGNKEEMVYYRVLATNVYVHSVYCGIIEVAS